MSLSGPCVFSKKEYEHEQKDEDDDQKDRTGVCDGAGDRRVGVREHAVARDEMSTLRPCARSGNRTAGMASAESYAMMDLQPEFRRRKEHACTTEKRPA